MQSRSQRMAPRKATLGSSIGITPLLRHLCGRNSAPSVKILSCGPSDLGPLCKGLGTVSPSRQLWSSPPFLELLYPVCVDF